MTVRLLHGDCRDVLPTLPAESFDCIVTSPPYWGLRDYGVEGQIGLEPTLDRYIEAIAGVARELWRVLKPNGVFWLNLGDTYARDPGKGDRSEYLGLHKNIREAGVHKASQARTLSGLKPKDLCMIPARVALRLQTNDWWLRSEIIWAKPNPMPESVTDRPTSSHEKVYLLTKGERYFYDAQAIYEAATNRPSGNKSKSWGTNEAGARGEGEGKIETTRGFVFNGSETRNARNVWTIPSQPYRGAHFATMPPALAERCILAGCPKGGAVLDPFGGSGTTGLVADRLGRNATLIDLNPGYREMQRERIEGDAPLFAQVSE